MLKAAPSPTTLSEAIRYFADPDLALAFVVQLRWPDGIRCPHCNSERQSFLSSRRIWKCKDCRKQFSIKVGTIFEDSALGLDKWLPCLWMLANCKNGVSSYEVHRALGVTQKTAWFMLGRIRLAMQAKSFQKFTGSVEADETFVGGLAKFMHRERRNRMVSGTGGKDKTAVMGILKRGRKGKSRVRAVVVPDRKMARVQGHIGETIEKGAKLYTDAGLQYIHGELAERYRHEMIDHAVAYVRGAVHTNGLENFWSLLKRSIKGTYVSVDPFHVFRYVNEQVFRFNHRDGKDGDRFRTVLNAVVGKRLTYAELAGHNLDPATT
jgi:transposase-like protein